MNDKLLPQFADNPIFREYEAFLIQLASLMAQGRGDEDEAEALRDSMDVLYYQLTEAEVHRLRGLSSDLYLTENSEMLSAQDRDSLKFYRDLWFGLRGHFWEYVLVLLRKRPAEIEAQYVAFWRTQAYEALGHLAASLAFVEYALKLRPNYSVYLHTLMETLQKLGRSEEALALAEMLFDDLDAVPELQITAAAVFIRSIKDKSDEEVQNIYRRIEAVVPKALTKAIETAGDHSAAVLVSGFLSLGFAYEGMGRPNEALLAYDRAVAIEPDSDPALSARGLLLFNVDRAQAIRDFEAAAAGGTPLVTPFFFLAFASLDKENYAECIALCNRVLSMKSGTRRVRAAAMNWSAIARYEQGDRSDEVRRRFEDAATLDPNNDNIRHNLSEFEKQVEAARMQTLDMSLSWQAGEASSFAPDLRPQTQFYTAMRQSDYKLAA